MPRACGSFYFTTSKLLNSKMKKGVNSSLICTQLVPASLPGSPDSYFVLFPGFTCQTSHASTAQMQQHDNFTGGVFDEMIISLGLSYLHSYNVDVWWSSSLWSLGVQAKLSEYNHLISLIITNSFAFPSEYIQEKHSVTGGAFHN